MQGVLFLVPLVGVVAACAALCMSRSRYYRAQKPEPAPKPRPRPRRALSDDERANVLATLDSDHPASAPRITPVWTQRAGCASAGQLPRMATSTTAMP